MQNDRRSWGSAQQGECVVDSHVPQVTGRVGAVTWCARARVGIDRISLRLGVDSASCVPGPKDNRCSPARDPYRLNRRSGLLRPRRARGTRPSRPYPRSRSCWSPCPGVRGGQGSGLRVRGLLLRTRTRTRTHEHERQHGNERTCGSYLTAVGMSSWMQMLTIMPLTRPKITAYAVSDMAFARTIQPGKRTGLLRACGC